MAEEDDHYWRFANEAAAYSFKDLSPEERVLAYKHWTEILNAFDQATYSATRPKVFIIDEINTIVRFGGASAIGKSFVKSMIDKLVLAASTGSKGGYVIWALAPIGGVAGLGLSRDEISAFNPLYVAKFGSNWNATTYQTAANNGIAPKILPSGFRENERIVGIGGEWESLPQSQFLSKQCVDFRSTAVQIFASAVL